MSCDARDGERIRSRELSRTGLATSLRGSSVVRWVGRSPTVPSGREWNGSQPGQGAAELLSPRPAIRKMQGQPACRAGEQGEEPPPEGLGGGYPLSQTDPRRPAGQVVGHRLDGQPGAVGGEAARGEMVQPAPYLRSRMAFSISWRRWSASSSRGQGEIPIARLSWKREREVAPPRTAMQRAVFRP